MLELQFMQLFIHVECISVYCLFEVIVNCNLPKWDDQMIVWAIISFLFYYISPKLIFQQQTAIRSTMHCSKAFWMNLHYWIVPESQFQQFYWSVTIGVCWNTSLIMHFEFTLELFWVCYLNHLLFLLSKFICWNSNSCAFSSELICKDLCSGTWCGCSWPDCLDLKWFSFCFELLFFSAGTIVGACCFILLQLMNAFH